MAQEPDIKLLIGALGGASTDGHSAVLIRKQLQSALSGKGGAKISIHLANNAANDLRQEIQKALSAGSHIRVKVQADIANATNNSVSSSGSRRAASSAATAIQRELTDNQKRFQDTERAMAKMRLSAALGYKEENDALAQMNRYYADIERSGNEAARASQKAADQEEKAAAAARKRAAATQMTATSVRSSAALNVQNFEKYLQGVSAKGRMDYAEQINQVRELYRIAEKDGLRDSLQRADSAARQLKATFKDLGYEGGNIFTYIQNKVKSFMVYLISSKLMNALIKGVRDGVAAVKDLNAEMTQLRIVTGASQAQMDKFLDSAIAKAKNVGSSVTDMLNSTTVYARLGYSMDESADLAEYTAMLQNVGDIDVESAQNAITAIVKAYNVGANQIETTMDKMVTVGNNFPISVSQLAEGMNNAGSALSAAGNSFDQSLALLAAANTTVQNISKSSTGLRTIAARIRNTKTELDDLGEAMTDAEYDNLVQSLTKANVSLTDTNGELRSTYDILQDVAKVWGDMKANDKAALAETLAGTRQQNIFYSLINQFNEASKAMEAMTGSAGAMASANSVYMESVGAKADRVKASFQELANTLLDSSILGWLYDFGNAALNAVSALDAWPAKIALVAAGLPTLIGLFRELRNMPLITSIGDSFKDLAHLPMMLSSFGTALSTISGTANITRSTLMGLVGDFKNLSVQQIAQIALSGQMSKADLFAALQAAGLTREERKLIAARLEEAGATGASTAATVTDTAAKGANQIATFSLTKSVKGLWAILKAHPILLLIGAVFGLVKAFNWLDDTFAITQGAQIKKTQKLQEEYTTLQGDVQDVEGKLKNVQDRIDELNRMDSPSFTDEDELKRLEKENELLKDQLAYKQQLAEEKAKETNESLQKQYDNQFGSGSYGQYESLNKTIQSTDEVGNVIFIGADITGEQRIDELIARSKELKAISKDSWTQENQDELDAINSELETMAHRMSDLAGQVQENDGVGKELYNTFYDLWDLLIRASQGDFWLNSSTEAFDKIWNDSKFSKAKAGLLSLAEQGELTAEALASPEYADFVSALVQSGIACDDAGFHYTDVANHIVALSKAAKEEGAAGANSLKTALAGLSDETTVLRDAMSKVDGSSFEDWLKGADGSWDNLKSLLDKFPDLRDELEAYNRALIAGEDPQKAFITLQRAMNAALQDFNADKVYEGVNDVVDAFNDYGAGSNQVLQAVQNLDQYIPGLTNQLYSQDSAFSQLHGTTQLTADAFYEYCAAAIEAERTSREIDISNLTTDLSDLAAMAMTAGHSMKEAMGLAKDEAYNRSGESFGIDDSMAKLTEWYETAMANLEVARNKWRRSQSSKKSKEVYVPDVDPLYQYLQTVEDINDDLDRLDLDEKLLDEDDFEGKNKFIEERIAKLEELKTALHELNNARDVEISAAVGKLNGYGNFQAAYDVKSGQALIGNMDALKGLTGDTAKAAEALISTIENGSKAALSTSNEYMEALVEQNSLLKEQRELQEGASDDRIERHRNAISLLQNQQGVYEGNLDYQAAVNSLKEQKSHWVEIQNIAHKMAEDIRAAHPDITDDDPLLKKWIDLWWEANGEIDTANEKFVEDSLARLDSFIQQADNFNWWDNIDTTKVNMLEKKLETIHQLYADGIIPDAATYKKLVDETAKEIYDEKLNAIEQVIDYTKKLIEEEVRLRKEELEEQVDDYKKIVDLKKESLRASKDEADYQKSVAEKTKAIAQLQQQINTLALSDDRRDIAERKKLEEELAGLQNELADTQADHTLEAQEKALDDSYDAFEKEKNDEIKKLEATIDTEGKLYALAIERIDRDWDTLYRDLMQMNSLYWDGIAGETGIKGAWDTAKQAAEGYKGTLETIQGIEKERAAVSGNGTSVGSSAVSDKNAAYLTGDIDKQKQLQAIGAQMQTNSQMWHTAYNANNKGQMEALQKANQRLADDVEKLTGQRPVFDSKSGYWKLGNGEHFYEVYHKGGIVGSNEEFAKVEDGELIVPKEHVKPTMMMLEWGNSLASKARELFSGGGLVSSAMSDAIKGATISPAASAIVNNNAPSFAPNIQVEVKYDGSASSADAKRFGENITAGMLEAFSRKGIGTGAKPFGVTI